MWDAPDHDVACPLRSPFRLGGDSKICCNSEFTKVDASDGCDGKPVR